MAETMKQVAGGGGRRKRFTTTEADGSLADPAKDNHAHRRADMG